jgi:hypothetical protein
VPYQGSLPSDRGLLIVGVRDGADGGMALLEYSRSRGPHASALLLILFVTDEEDSTSGKKNLKNQLLSYCKTRPVFVHSIIPLE